MNPHDLDDFIDRRIKQAQEEGTFENLPGKGKPLTHLDSDPLNSVLKAQGFTTRWIDLDHDIRQKTEIAEQAVKRTYEWIMQTWSAGSADRGFAQEEWRKARRIFRQRLDEINQLIKSYNLQVPSTIGQKFSLKEEEELRRLGLTIEMQL